MPHPFQQRQDLGQFDNKYHQPALPSASSKTASLADNTKDAGKFGAAFKEAAPLARLSANWETESLDKWLVTPTKLDTLAAPAY